MCCVISPAARALRPTGTSLYTFIMCFMFFQGFFRVALGFAEGFFGLFPRDFLGFFRVCVKSAENQDCRSADSPQRVIKHVRGFANPGTSSYNISQHSGRPQSTVRVTQNEVLDNHPKRVWGMAQVLAVILLHQARCSAMFQEWNVCMRMHIMHTLKGDVMLYSAVMSMAQFHRGTYLFQVCSPLSSIREMNGTG